MTERTFIMVKPDGVMRGLVGKIIKKFENTGLKLVAIKMARPNEKKVAGFYPSSNEWFSSVGEKTLKGYQKLGVDVKKDLNTDDPIEIGKTIKSWLIKYISKGPVVAMIWEGNKAVKMGRKLVGNTEPFSAEPGTLRGTFSPDSYQCANLDFRSMFNTIHASGSTNEAKEEIVYWFSESEIFDYQNSAEMVWDFIKS